MRVLEELYLALLQYLTMDSKAINQLYESSTLREGNYHVVPQLICNYAVAKNCRIDYRIITHKMIITHEHDHRADLEQITQIIGHMRIVLA